MWYQFGPFQAYYEVGRYDEVLALANATLATTTHVEELYYWKGMALRALNDDQSARQAFERRAQTQSQLQRRSRNPGQHPEPVVRWRPFPHDSFL